MLRSSFRCHTNVKRAEEETDGEEEEEEMRASRISREGVKRSQGMVHRIFMFTFSSGVTITDEHLEKMVIFQNPDQNLFHLQPKVKGWTQNVIIRYLAV